MTNCRTKPSRSPTPARLAARPILDDPVMGTPTQSRTEPIRILRLAQVIQATGLGKTKIYELQASGQFPMRVQIATHSVGWVEEEVQAWLSRRLAARNSGTPSFGDSAPATLNPAPRSRDL